MKSIVFIVGLITILCALKVDVVAQAPSYSWINTAGTRANDELYNVEVDQNGNTYVLGRFGYSDTSDIVLDSITLNNRGWGDLLVAKYNPFGDLLWAKTIGSTDTETEGGLSIDTNGNCFVTGTLKPLVANTPLSPVYFDSIVVNGIGSSDIFLAKYDAQGNVIFAKVIGGLHDESSKSIEVAQNGGFIILGNFVETITIDSIVISNSANTRNFFIANFDSNGNVIWVRSAGGFAVNNRFTSLALDTLGNSYAYGYYGGTISFDSVSLPQSNGVDAFLAKHDIQGNILWAKRITTGIGTQMTNQLDLGSNNDLYLSGYFISEAIFPNIVLTNSQQNSENAFIAKYDLDGNFKWVNHITGDGEERVLGLEVIPSGDFYAIGRYGSSATGPGNVVLGNDTLLCEGWNDIFIVKFDSTSNIIWHKKITGSGKDEAYGITSDYAENIYVCGVYGSTFGIGLTSFDSTTFNAAGTGDIFLAKIGNNPLSVAENEPPKSKLNVYPNPADTFTTIAVPDGNKEKNIRAVLTNFLGQEILSKDLSKDSMGVLQLGLENITQGIYSLQILTDKRVYGSKLVVE